MALPDYREDGWLPDGHHQSTWSEISTGFGGEPGSRRERLSALLIQWRDAVRAKGKKKFCHLDMFDGDKVSKKPKGVVELEI
jgi:hypothetical protein